MGNLTPGYRTICAVLIVFALVVATLHGGSKVLYHVHYNTVEKIDAPSFETKTFARNPNFEDMSHDNDAAWAEAVMPKKLGFIYVKHNESLLLERGISMFHAMHCLSLLREMLQEPPADPSQSRHHGLKGEASKHLRQEHVPHCLSYIAQVRGSLYVLAMFKDFSNSHSRYSTLVNSLRRG